MEKLKLKLDKYDLQLVCNILSTKVEEMGVRELSGMQLLLGDRLSDIISKLLGLQFPVKDEYNIKLTVGDAYAVYHSLTTTVYANMEIWQQNSINSIIMVLDKYLLPVLKRERKNMNQYRITNENWQQEEKEETLLPLLGVSSKPNTEIDLETEFEKWEQEVKEETLQGLVNEGLVDGDTKQVDKPMGALSGRLLRLKKMATDVKNGIYVPFNTPITRFKTRSDYKVAEVLVSASKQVEANKPVLFQPYQLKSTKRTCFSNCTEECRQCSTGYIKKLKAVIHSVAEPNDHFQSCLY